MIKSMLFTIFTLRLIYDNEPASKIICIPGNDYMCEIIICKSAWLDGCMRNDSKSLSKFIYKTTSGFITYNHTIRHSYLTKAESGITNR
jgi:hypothetical protein